MRRRGFSSCSFCALKEKIWDAIVVGASHNGLIAAFYFAQSGLSAAVLERRHVIGGAAVTEELIPVQVLPLQLYPNPPRPSIVRWEKV